MMPLLSIIPSSCFRSLQSRAATCKVREDGPLSLILTLMAGVGFLAFGFTEAVCKTPQRLFSKDDPQKHIACSIPHLMPIRSTQTCIRLLTSRLTQLQVFEKQCPYLVMLLLICLSPLINIIPQLPPEYEPLNFPLAHSVYFLTAYSEPLRVFSLDSSTLTLPRRRIVRTATGLFCSLLMVWPRASEIH